jgi:hypothetical protein
MVGEQMPIFFGAKVEPLQGFDLLFRKKLKKNDSPMTIA